MNPRNVDSGSADGSVDLARRFVAHCVALDMALPFTTARARNPQVAMACGRLWERDPERSVFNRVCDWEWEAPPGDSKACGGNALMQLSAFQAAGGVREQLIAGEEPELCMHLRRAGSRVHRLAAEMALHDAVIPARLIEDR